MNTNIGICGYPEEEMASMTVEEALQQADKLKEQGCITTTAKALIALADELRFYRVEHQVLADAYRESKVEIEELNAECDEWMVKAQPETLEAMKRMGYKKEQK